MKRSLILVTVFALVLLLAPRVMATFSIVAVDTITGDVGSAGASCIAGAQIIEDVVEGVGAINTQAFYISANQDNAHTLLLAGLTPDSILGWLWANDAGSPPDPNVRQYGVVTLAGQGVSAAFTGALTNEWKGHLTGPTYAVQGNILLGPQILDSMEFYFLNTAGRLEDRLMAALEAAKVPGADLRCLANNKSAISAFIKVVRIGDGGIPYLSEIVGNTTGSTEPIDILRTKYDNWKLRQRADPESSLVIISDDTLRADGSSTATITIVPINLDGDTVRYPDNAFISNTGDGALSAVTNNGDRTFSATVTAGVVGQPDTLTVSVESGGEVVQLNSSPMVIYYACGDINFDFDGPNILDLTYIVDFKFRSGSPLQIPDAGDLDGDGNVTIIDLTILVDFLFRQGIKPDCGW